MADENMNQMDDFSDDEYIVRRKKAPAPVMKVTPSGLAKAAAEALEAMRAKSPRVVCFAHASASPFVANALLALGAEPCFAEDSGEATQLAGSSDTLFAGVGAVSKPLAEAVRAAVARANASQIPWALDPDDAGSLSLRSYVAKELMRRYPSVIRGTPSEMLALSGLETEGDDAAATASRRLAEVTRAAVLMTGAADRIYGENAPVAVVKNGTPLLVKVAGVGAAQGAVAAALLAAVGRAKRYEAAAAAALIMSVAGEIAAAKVKAPGSFAGAFLDVLCDMKPGELAKRASIEIIA
jgi:hydroxyethylthiazole kinase